MKPTKYLIALVISLAFTNVKGQEFNPLALSVNYLHNTSRNKPLAINGNFAINLPVHRDSLFTVLVGSSFKSFKVDLPGDTMNINYLYSISVPFTLVSKVSSGKMITFLFEPVIGADFDGLSHKNIANLTFKNSKGEIIELNQIADISYELGASALERTDRISYFHWLPKLLEVHNTA